MGVADHFTTFLQKPFRSKTRVPEQSLRCDFCDGINVLIVTVKKLSWRSELLLYIGSKYYMLSFETSFVEIDPIKKSLRLKKQRPSYTESRTEKN